MESLEEAVNSGSMDKFKKENDQLGITGLATETREDAATKPDIALQSQPEEEASLPVDEGKSGTARPLMPPPSAGAEKPDPDLMGKLPSSQELQRNAQQFIDGINNKRNRDTTLLGDLKKDLDAQVSKSCGALEEAIIESYELHSQSIQSKLHEYFAVIERIGQLEAELMEFKSTLGDLYTDMSNMG